MDVICNINKRRDSMISGSSAYVSASLPIWDSSPASIATLMLLSTTIELNLFQ